MMSFTGAVQHTFTTLLLSLSLVCQENSDRPTDDVLSFVERSESGAHGGDIRPRALVLRPAVRYEADQ